jgi:hypothetical protein
MPIYILIILVAVGLIMLHSIDASLGRILGALEAVLGSIQSRED